MPLFRDENGLVFEADDVFGRSMGFEPVSPEEEHEMLKAEAMQERADDRGFLGTANAGLTGLASGLTLGASDFALGSFLTDDERATLQSDIAAHPIARGTGEVAGALAGGMAAPGSSLAKTPAGYLGSVAGREVEAGLARGGLKGTAKALGAMGTEGAIQSGGQYIGMSALENKDVTAEGLSGALGSGFAFGAAGGGAALGVAKGTIAARRLFSRAMDGAEGARAAESAWTKAQQEIFEADEATARVARQRLEDIQAAKLEALRAQQEAKSAVAEERIRAAGAVEKPVVEEPGMPVTHDEGPAPLIDVAPPKGGGQTSVFQRPDALDPEAARAFDSSLPSPDEGPVPLAEFDKPKSGQATSVFKPESTEVIPPAKKIAAKAADVVDETTDLEKQLAGTKKEIDSGKSIKEVKGAKPVVEKQGRPLPKGIADMFDELDEFSQVRKVEDIAGAERAGLKAEGRMQGPRMLSEARYEKTAELLGPAVAKEERALMSALDARDAARAQMDKLMPWGGVDTPLPDSDEVIPVLDTEGFPPTGELGHGPGGTKVAKRPKSIEALDVAHEEALRTAAEATDPYTRGQAIKAADELEQMLAKLSPREDLVADVNKAHHIFDSYDNALRELADAVGPESSHQLLQQYIKEANAAREAAMGKATDRATRAVEDMEHFGPTRKSPKERVQYARERKLDADRAYDKLKVDEIQAQRDYSAAQGKVKAGEKAKKAALKLDAKAARAAATPGKYEKYGVLGGVLEMADLPGMPKPSDLPVVGPLLGAYLKFKTLKAALGRTGGRIPATADARVAALAARTKDRVARAVDRSLGLVVKAGTKATKALPPAAGILAKRIYDDGSPDVKKGASLPELATARMRELQAYVSTPMAIELDVRRELRGVADPDVILAAEKHRRMMFEHLASTLPPIPQQGLLEKVQWKASPLQALSFARRMEAASNPADLLERTAATQQAISFEAAETLRTVYPQLFALAQQRLMQRAAESPTSIPYKKRIQLSLVYNLPLDSGLDPDRLALTQSVFEKTASAAPISPDQPAAAPPTPSVAGPTNLAASYVQPGDRREFQQR